MVLHKGAFVWFSLWMSGSYVVVLLSVVIQIVVVLLLLLRKIETIAGRLHGLGRAVPVLKPTTQRFMTFAAPAGFQKSPVAASRRGACCAHSKIAHQLLHGLRCAACASHLIQIRNYDTTLAWRGGRSFQTKRSIKSRTQCLNSHYSTVGG